jgi:hypothetical protein
MTQEVLQEQSHSHNTFEAANQELQSNVSKLKSSLNAKASTAKIIANIQECPCLAKCVHEIQNTNYSNIDSLYSAKHEYAKTKIIDAIHDKFSDLITVTSEHKTTNGKLDIAILPGSKIVLKYKDKIIAIELKSGKWADASMLFQIERYHIDCDTLIFVRIPTEEVTLIHKEPLVPSLTESVTTLNGKILTILEGQRDKVQGDWCNGCNVQCNFRKPSKWSNASQPTLAEFGDFMKSINSVIVKVLNHLTEELR